MITSPQLLARRSTPRMTCRTTVSFRSQTEIDCSLSEKTRLPQGLTYIRAEHIGFGQNPPHLPVERQEFPVRWEFRWFQSFFSAHTAMTRNPSAALLIKRDHGRKIKPLCARGRNDQRFGKFRFPAGTSAAYQSQHRITPSVFVRKQKFVGLLIASTTPQNINKTIRQQSDKLSLCCFGKVSFKLPPKNSYLYQWLISLHLNI